MESYIVSLVGVIFEVFFANVFFKKFGKPKVKPAVFYLVNACCLILQEANNIVFLGKSVLVTVLSLIIFLIISLIYDFSWKYKAILSLSILCILFIGETLTGMVIMMLFKLNMAEVQANLYLFLLCTVVSKFLSFMIIALIRGTKAKYKVSMKKSLPFLISSVIMSFVLFFCGYNIQNNTYRLAILVVSVLLLVSDIILLSDIQTQSNLIMVKEKLAISEKQLEMQISHYKTLYEQQQEIRTFRHDIKNIMRGLSVMMHNGEYDAAEEEINKFLKIVDQTETNSVNTNNPVVDSIIQYYVNAAKAEDITVKTNIHINEKIIVNQIELGLILGNSLSNAIEATAKLPKEERTPVTLDLTSIDKHILISVENRTLETIDLNNLSTTKQDKALHGYGIASIKAIVSKYNGIVYFDNKDGVFTINIHIDNGE